MKNILYTIFITLGLATQAQVLISTDTNNQSPSDQAVLELAASDKVMIVPRLTSSAIASLKNSGEASEGMIVFDIEKKCFLGYEITDWKALGDACIGTTPPDPVAFEGAFAFTGMRSDDPDKFSILTLVEIPVGEVFFLTDNGWKDDNTFRVSEGIMKWTVDTPQPIPARTEIVFESVHATTGTFDWTVSAGHGSVELAQDSRQSEGPSLTESGDNLFIYTATDPAHSMDTVETFLAGLKLEGGWNSTSSSTSTSAIPQGLIEDVTALALEASGDNQKVSCANIVPGLSDDDLRAILNEHTNWAPFPDSTDPLPTGCSY